jgi:hypothetical protein
MTSALLRLVVPLCWVVASAWAANARAAGHTSPLLTISFRGCLAVSTRQVETSIAVELRRPVLLVEDAAAGGPGPEATTAISVICDDLHALVRIRDLLTGKTVERVVDLGATPPVARPHLLALSVVELVAASWIELQSNRRPVVQVPPSPAANAEARAQALELLGERLGLPRGPRLFAAAIAQTSSTTLQTWGGAVVLSGTIARPLAWRLDLALQHGQRTVPLGHVTADLASAGGALVAQVQRGRATLGVGLGARAGWAWVRGIPDGSGPAVGDALRGFWWGPVTLVGASVAVWRRLALELTIEGGHVMLPVVAMVQGSNPVAVDGTWIRGGAGVGITF